MLVHVMVLSRDRIVGEGPTTDVLSHPRGECTRAVAGAVTIPDLAIQRARRTQAAVKP
ncbi:peptide ABC transporter ATP-binding protein [Mycolicibacterium neoaurum]|nr:peptide ABC transporter ATP-binding protein [Mycolicibacterium neoaurum]MDO3403666.1 peptide ABC transporter ATP-binding protein [Mycolicibacterium neoaurum]